MVLLFTRVRGTRLRSTEYSFSPTREEDPVSPAQNAFPNLLPPAAPFLSAAKEMGERTPPKTRGFWISFWSISMRWKKVPQGIGHGPAPAAADVAGRDHWQFYRFKRLSNRALAAAGRKCRCGPLGRKIRQASAPPRGAWERQRLLSPSTGACHSTPPARYVGAAAGRGAEAIPYGPFCVVSRSA